MSGRRRLGLVGAAAGVALVGFMVVRRGDVEPRSPVHDPVAPPATPASRAASAPAATAPLPVPPPAPDPDPAPAALTEVGAKRALAAIEKNEQTRRMYMRLQPLGLSPEQRERVLLILGAHAMRPAQESPTLQALRASGRTGRLSDEEVQRIHDEQQQIEDRALRSVRPALASVLTPPQLGAVMSVASGPP